MDTVLLIVKFLIASVALVAFGWGLVYATCPEWVVAIKKRRGEYDNARKKRVEIRNYGIQLLAISAAIGSVLYSVESYQLSRREFNLKNRPFLQAKPTTLRTGNFYDILQDDGDPYLQFSFTVTNVGSIPAYDIKFGQAISLRQKTVMSEVDDRKQVIFPGDTLLMESSAFHMRGERVATVSDVQRIIGDSEVIFSLRIDYRGVAKKEGGRPYYTAYNFGFLDRTRHEVISVEADEVR